MTEGSTCLKYFLWFKEVLPKAVISAIDLKPYKHLLISSVSNRSLIDILHSLLQKPDLLRKDMADI